MAVHTHPDIQSFNKRLGNALLTSSDTTNTVYGTRLSSTQYHRNIDLLNLVGTPVLSKQGIERVASLARLGWVRLSKGSSMPRALSWRLKQLKATPSSSKPTIYFASMPTLATKQVLTRFNSTYPNPRVAPSVFSASSTVFFPYGMFHLPSPYEICHRPMLRVAGMALEHDIQVR
jgi:hypothetical protein